MITNYKMDQPLTSKFGVEEAEKNSSRTWKHGAGRIVNHVETIFTRKPEKSVEGKQSQTIQSQHCESRFVPDWTDFFRFPSKKAVFIIRDKYSSRQTKL